jgi:hypothetical protein
LESGLSGGRHRAEIRTNYQNKPRVTDFENGNVYTIAPDAYTDNGTPIARQMASRALQMGGKKFSLSTLQILFESDVGLVNGQGSDPQAMLQVSKDGGATWGNELWRPIGKLGERMSRAVWYRFGSAYSFVFCVRITDPVKVVMLSEATDE